MTKLDLIAQGRTAEMFDWGDQQVLKLFRKEVSAETIEYEFAITSQVQGMINEVANAIEIIEVDGRNGIVFEKVAGTTMLQKLSKSPWTYSGQAKKMAELHTTIHRNKPLQELPILKDELKRQIEKVDSLGYRKVEVLRNLEVLPKGNSLLHGDFHPDNIIITPSRAVIIDWLTAIKGDPAADVARTILLLTLGDLPPGTPKIQKGIMTFIRQEFCKKYVSTYRKKTVVTKDEIQQWLVPLAAARLTEGISGREKERLVELINRVI